MAQTLKFGNGTWATKKGSTLAFNDEDGNYKPLPFATTRATSATRVNKEGLIEVVENDRPRIDYLDSEDGSLLLEPIRTNKISTSNDFNGSAWLVSDITATANQVVSPDGTLNASKLEATGNGSLRNQSEASFNDGYAYSIFIKKGNSRYVTIRSAFFTQSIVVGFDLDTLSAQTNGKIEDYGNDWYKLSISKNISGDADKSGYFYLYLPDSLGAQTSESGNYVYAYGGQIEDGSYPSSYIPTQGSAVTRVADTANGAGNSEVFSDSSGVLFADISPLADDGTFRMIGIFDSQTGNVDRIQIYYRSDANKMSFLIEENNVNQFLKTLDVNTTQYNKCAFQYGNTSSVYINGFKLAEETGITIPNDLQRLSFNEQNGGNDFYGKTKEIAYYNTALTDLELETLTSYRSWLSMVNELNLNVIYNG